MKLAVIADIHGNYRALETALAFFKKRGISHYLFMGDYAGDMAYPERVMTLIYSLREEANCYFIRGNKEDYWLDYEEGGPKEWTYGSSTTGMLLYNYQHLRPEDLDFYRELPIMRELRFSDLPPITVCHGTPNQSNGALREGDSATLDILEKDPNRLMLAAHTHVRMLIEHEGKCLINPGSLGLPLASQGKAQCLMLHGQEGTWTPEFIDLDYDLDAVLEELAQTGLYDWAPGWTKTTAYVLKTGGLAHSKVLTRAMTICKEQTGICEWPHIPEFCWDQAISEVLIEN